jgi:hypothetical protein
MITGKRGSKKKASLTVTGSRRLQYPPEPVTGSNHKKTQATHPISMLQYPKITRKNKHDATISKNHKKKQAQPRQTTHNEDRRYNNPPNLLLVATGCKEHCGRLGAL